ncbi:MAG: ATP-binding protein [Candidatus Uhrbacteria bacterium]|nr:ATP-binding protein [Patescibacteria group bacterium]MBU1907236.1 ATP-binding protein [Patescibacteria group bacterium]
MNAKTKFNLQEVLVSGSVFIIGSVFSVKGKDIVIKVNKDKNLPHLFFNGKAIKNVSVGLSNYVKILKGFTEIICKVEGEYLEEDKYQRGKKYTNEKQKIDRFLNVSVFGFYDNEGKFQHGIKEMPLIGSECRLLSRSEFERLHQLSGKKELSITLGSLIDEEAQDIDVSVKRLFAGHVGIFGNTGSGKSNTLARMFTELFSLEGLGENFKDKSRFIFIDFNGEYSKEENDEILTSNKVVYRLKTVDDSGEKYPILKSEIEKLEILSILLDATEKTQQPFLHRAVDRDWFDRDNDDQTKEIKSINDKLKDILMMKDKNFNVPFLKKFVKDFEELGFRILNEDKDINDLKYHGNDNCAFYFINNDISPIYADTNETQFIGPSGYFNVSVGSPPLTVLQRIQFKILDQYYFEILNGYANQEHISPLIGRLKKRFNMLNKVFNIQNSLVANASCNVQIIDLKNVNLEIKKVIPLLVCKTNYDEQKTRRGTDKNNSLHIIIDEAHNILSENSNRESESWKDYRLETFEEIIKEGRKFGVFLTIASQRPSDISPTIISQLHNYFIHRLMNDNDLRAINKAVSYLDKLSFDSISNLSTGCCFIAGQMTQFPLSVKIKLLHKDVRPQSETIDLDKLWHEH